MRKTLVTLAALAVGALGGWAASAAATPDPAPATPVSVVAPAAPSYDPFLQVNFPCEEDEVLTFDPRFGPDRVGCIHYEDIAR